jgi:hypothetical protein
MRQRLSYSNVMATLAVFVALGGTSFAAIKITGKNVTNGSLTGADIKKHSVQLNRLLGSLPAGTQGPKGDQGSKGDAGAPAPTNAITGANVVDDSLTTADVVGAEVDGTVSLSGIPDGRCTQVTFSISEARIGQTPIVSTAAAIQNGIVMYPNRVSSDGHVEVNACNFSGTAMTAISNFPIRVITFG